LIIVAYSTVILVCAKETFSKPTQNIRLHHHVHNPSARYRGNIAVTAVFALSYPPTHAKIQLQKHT